MIIFDTNAVRRLNPESPKADLIRMLRRSGIERVAVPWMVLEEMIGQQVEPYMRAHDEAARSLDKLAELIPWTTVGTLKACAPLAVPQHWREVYSTIFEVIETSGDAARQALVREAYVLRPAKKAGDKKLGARDAAIWLSIIDYMKQHPQEKVYFVTANTADFGDGSTFDYPMDQDLKGMEDRPQLLRTFEDVVAKFTEALPGENAEAAARPLIQAEGVGDVIESAAFHRQKCLGFHAQPVNRPDGVPRLVPATVWVRSWTAPPQVECLGLTDATAHKIGDHTWYAARTRWLLDGMAYLGPETDQPVQEVACQWEVNLGLSRKLLSDG